MDHHCLSDGTFGPVVEGGCRGGFDFTLTFENGFFSIVPSALFVGAAALRIFSLLSQPPNAIVSAPQWAQAAKQLLIASFIGLSLAQVIWTATSHVGYEASLAIVESTALAAAVLQLVAGFCMALLSALEHARSPRPSIVLTTYLSLSIPLDAARVRTAWLSGPARYPTGHVGQSIITAMLALKLAVLASESLDKSPWLTTRPDRKAISSEETSGILGLGLFTWINRLLLRGYTTALTIPSLYLLDGAMSSRLLHHQLDARLDLLQHGHFPIQRWELARSLARTLAWPLLILPVVPRLLKAGFTLSQPFFISSLVSYLGRSPDLPQSADRADGLIGAAALIYIGIALSSSLYRYLVYRGLYMARGCLVAAIYAKTTTQPLANGKNNAEVDRNGNDENDKPTNSDSNAAVTLMSTDVERIVVGLVDLHEVWASPLEVAIGCWMLQRRLGLAFLSPLVIVILCLVVMAWVGKTTLRKQKDWIASIQARVSTTATAIRHFKALKIAALDPDVGPLIQHQRIEDLKFGSRFRFLQVVAGVVAFAPQCLSPIFAFAFADRNLDVETLFSSLSFLVLLTEPLATFFQSIPLILASLACISRIQSFLAAVQRNDFRACASASSADLSSPSQDFEGSGEDALELGTVSLQKSGLSLVSIVDGQFGWEEKGRKTLTGVNLIIRPSSFSMVTGPIASGKSSLCKAIMGEIPVSMGRIDIHPSIANRIAFCDQHPVVFAGTVRDNIIRYASFNERRYRDVVFAAGFDQDIEGFARGDRMLLKGGGDAALSGGQKARLALARALYQDASLVIIDDALNSLDGKTERLVFDRCFGHDGLLRRRGSAALLCSHATRHLSYAEQVITLTSTGHVEVEARGGKIDDREQSWIAATSVDSSETPTRHPSSDDHGTSADGDDDNQDDSNNVDAEDSETNPLDELLDRGSRELSEMGVYAYYFGSIPRLYIALLFLSAVAFGFGLNFPTVWISIWANDSLHRGSSFYLGMYAFMRTMQLVGVAGSASIVIIAMVRSSGLELHNSTLSATLDAPLTFLSALSPGKVINLFSQDMTIIDSELPISFLNLSVGIFGVLGMAVVIASSSPWIALSYPFLIALLWTLQRFYLRTSKQLRLLDLEAKSPLYAHFLDTIHALPTIRAFGWVQHEQMRAYSLLDTSQRPAYLLAMIQQWLILVLDLVVAGMAILLTALSTNLDSSSGLTGASMVTLMSLGEMVAGLVRSYTQLETSIGAVGRLLTFTRTVPVEGQSDGEKHDSDVDPGPFWPQRGQIDLRNVSAIYSTGIPRHGDSADSSSTTLALDHINLSISAGEKIAVCGRTGSGKSSLILVLLRLLDPMMDRRGEHDSAIDVDGVSLSRIPRSVVRQRIIAVPQDCVFLPDGSSIRANLTLGNSSDDHHDQLYMEVMHEVRLDGFVADQGGLAAPFRVDRLSAGQKQMFSLARAMLRQRQRQMQRSATADPKTDPDSQGGDGGILLLDEMGSHVDAETEKLVYHIIRRHFVAYTVIMVAHRLEALADWVDRVVVLDAGSVVEVGKPAELREMSPHGWFAQLITAGMTAKTTSVVE